MHGYTSGNMKAKTIAKDGSAATSGVAGIALTVSNLSSGALGNEISRDLPLNLGVTHLLGKTIGTSGVAQYSGGTGHAIQTSAAIAQSGFTPGTGACVCDNTLTNLGPGQSHVMANGIRVTVESIGSTTVKLGLQATQLPPETLLADGIGIGLLVASCVLFGREAWKHKDQISDKLFGSIRRKAAMAELPSIRAN